MKSFWRIAITGTIPFITVLGSERAWAVGGVKPTFSIGPDASMILLEGTDTSNVEHVLHSEPSFGIDVDLTIQRLVGAWAPKFEFSTRQIRFSGANGETIQYTAGYFNSYALGIENQILANWVASGLVGYSDQLFPWSPSSNIIEIDRISTPVATLQTSAGVFEYKSFLFAVNAKVIGYFPVTTPNYSAKFGYGLRPSVSTTHVFSNHISGEAEFYYQKRIQNSSAFELTEQDFGLAFSFLFQ